MSMLAFTTTPDFFFPRLASGTSAETVVLPSGRFKREIVTQIEPAPRFFRAEEYHQRYLEKRGLSHCAI